jgi:integrase
VRFLFGPLAISRFGPRCVKEIVRRMIQGTHLPPDRHPKPLCRNKINKRLGRIKRILKWGVAEELVPQSIYEAVRCVAGLGYGRSAARETEPVRPVAREIIDATKAHAKAIISDMIEAQYLLGCRPGELLNMKVGEIDLGKVPWAYRPTRHKNSHRGLGRTIYIGPTASSILSKYMIGDPGAYVFSPARSEQARREELSRKRKTPLSCGNRPGSNRRRAPHWKPRDHYGLESYALAIQRACDKAFPPPAGMTDPDELAGWRKSHRWAPNQLRHARGTDLRERYGVEGSQHILGHATLTATQLYSEKSDRHAREIAAAVG